MRYCSRKNERKAGIDTEIWDLYSEERELTGRVHVRGEEIPQGFYHLVVHVWIRNCRGEYLIAQRSAERPTHPLKWECVGGSALKGEDSLSAAVRETREEVGLEFPPENGKLLFSVTGRVINGVKFSDIVDVWLFEYDGAVDLKKASTNEVAQTLWMSRKQIKELFDKGGLVDTLEYFFDNEDLQADPKECGRSVEKPKIGNKVIILGCPGSGKSTFAKALHEQTGLPLFHLDNVWWKEDGTHITREEFDSRLRAIMQGPEWIIDGNYSRTFEPRFAGCDTVIVLDPGEEECMKGITERIGKQRSDMPWTETSLDPELAELVQRYDADERPKLRALMEKYPGRRQLVFKTRAQAWAWLDEM